MISINDRVIYNGQKATVIQVWKKMVRILTAGMEKMNVAIADLEILDGQLDLIHTTRYEKPRTGFTDWEIDMGSIDETENAIAPTEKSWLPAIDPDETGLNPPIAEPKYQIGDLVRFEGKTQRIFEIGGWELYEDDSDDGTYAYGYLLESECARYQYTNTIPEFFLELVDPNPVDPNPVDPNRVDPNRVDPNRVDPNPVDPNRVDPNRVDPNPVDPNRVDPNRVDPNRVDPNPVDPNSVDPNPVDPNPVDPNRVDPNPVDPNPVDPNSVDPNHPTKGYEEIKTIKGTQYRYWRWYEGKRKRSKYLGTVKVSNL